MLASEIHHFHLPSVSLVSELTCSLLGCCFPLCTSSGLQTEGLGCTQDDGKRGPHQPAAPHVAPELDSLVLRDDPHPMEPGSLVLTDAHHPYQSQANLSIEMTSPSLPTTGARFTGP